MHSGRCAGIEKLFLCLVRAVRGESHVEDSVIDKPGLEIQWQTLSSRLPSELPLTDVSICTHVYAEPVTPDERTANGPEPAAVPAFTEP